MRFQEKPDGIRTVFRLSLRLRKHLDLTEKIRLKSMVWSHLSISVKKAYGNTKVCGKISQVRLVSGRIWRIHMLLTTMNLSSLSGGRSRKSGIKVSSTKDLRSFLTVRAVEHRFLHRKLHRDIRMSKSVLQS